MSEIYDSAPDTKAHIQLVGENIDKICKALRDSGGGYSLSNSTLVDALGFLAAHKFMTIDEIINELQIRKAQHDITKLQEPEKRYFDTAPKLTTLKYGSSQYAASLEYLKPALAHHYSAPTGRHHPQHHKNGIQDMNWIDRSELICDWDASSKRTAGGNIHMSIELNKKREGFNLNSQLANMFHNTADMFYNCS